MKYLKHINEDRNFNLDFETFKEFMYPISDDYDVEFDSFNKDDNIAYNCIIYNVFEDYPRSENINYDDFLNGDIELKSPNEIEDNSTTFNDILKNIDSDLELLDQLEIMKKNIKELKNIIYLIGAEIYPRIKKYNNFKEYEIYYTTLTNSDPIQFEIILKK